MAFTPPVFNLDMDWWNPPPFPSAMPTPAPNFYLPEVQLYRNSRNADSNTGRAAIRTSIILLVGLTLPTVAGAAGNPIVECPAGSGAFYRIERGEWMHRGFPNEYISMDATPCFSNGTRIETDTDLT